MRFLNSVENSKSLGGYGDSDRSKTLQEVHEVSKIRTFMDEDVARDIQSDVSVVLFMKPINPYRLSI